MMSKRVERKEGGRLRFFCVYLLAGWVTASAGGAILYQDDFSGAAGDGLDGTVPDVSVGGAAWVASSNIKADGSLVAGDSSAYLPFVPVAGNVYELSAAVDANGDWLSMGFAVGSGITTRILPTASLWGLIRQPGGGADQTFFDLNGGTDNGAATSTSSASVLKIVLNTTAADWVVEWHFDGGLQRTETIPSAQVPAITHVYVSSTSGSTGGYGDFMLRIAEPPARLIAIQ